MHSGSIGAISVRDCGHTQAALPSETVHGQTVGRLTITVITHDNNFVLDVTRDVSHCVPYGGNLLINYRCSVLERVDQIRRRFTMVYEPDCSVDPTSLNFFEQYLCVGPRNWQARDRGYVLCGHAVPVLI